MQPTGVHITNKTLYCLIKIKTLYCLINPHLFQIDLIVLLEHLINCFSFMVLLNYSEHSYLSVFNVNLCV